MSKQFKGSLMLVMAAMIWGAAFVAQSIGMDYVEPFTFLFCRSLLGALALLPVLALLGRGHAEAPKNKKSLWTGGLACGGIMFVATSLQQFGLLSTSAGKSGFLTALYVVLVPILGVFLHKKIRATMWAGVGIAAAALYLLCVKGRFSIGRGELLTLGSALCFACHILAIDHFSPKTDGVKLSCLQFFVSSALSGAAMLVFETPSLTRIAQCWLPIGYAGILSCGAAYTLQILAQRDTNPTVASLLMSLESVFAVLFGWLLLHEHLAAKELFGCVLMLGAIVLAQLPVGRPLPRKKRQQKTDLPPA